MLNSAEKSVKGSKILVVGVAYKGDIDDFRESPALDVITELERRGARVEYHDPYIPSFRSDHLEMQSVPLTADKLKAADCVIITTAHKSLDYDLIVKSSRAVFDTRNVLKGRAGNHIFRL